MEVSFKKLWKMLIDKDMKKKDLQASAGISWASVTKLSKNENVSMEVLMKVCQAMNCDIGDIMELIPTEDDPKQNEVDFMANKSSSKSLISKASPHTIKKFELIEEYVKSWAQKLMLNNFCNTLVFIDCMCNSGIYINDETGQQTEGTPVRVAKVLLDVARNYPGKNIEMYLNDIDPLRVEEIKKHLPSDERNFRIITQVGDASEFLHIIGPQLYDTKYLHYFLLYDPYDASIDWEALFPFFRNWGEVLINHMVSDPVRAITQAKRKSTKEKYENTYLADFEKLVPYGSDKKAYEKRVREIITTLKGSRKYYVAAFPFYNSQNSQVYSLLHCTSNEEGFKLYKKCAWKVFGGQSSTKHLHSNPDQLVMDFGVGTSGIISTQTDESCFTVRDIAKYLSREFAGRQDVLLDELWNHLDSHPVFPSDGFRKEIRAELKSMYGVKQRLEYNPTTGKKEYLLSFQNRD